MQKKILIAILILTSLKGFSAPPGDSTRFRYMLDAEYSKVAAINDYQWYPSGGGSSYNPSYSFTHAKRETYSLGISYILKNFKHRKRPGDYNIFARFGLGLTTFFFEEFMSINSDSHFDSNSYSIDHYRKGVTSNQISLAFGINNMRKWFYISQSLGAYLTVYPKPDLTVRYEERYTSTTPPLQPPYVWTSYTTVTPIEDHITFKSTVSPYYKLDLGAKIRSFIIHGGIDLIYSTDTFGFSGTNYTPTRMGPYYSGSILTNHQLLFRLTFGLIFLLPEQRK